MSTGPGSQRTQHRIHVRGSAGIGRGSTLCRACKRDSFALAAANHVSVNSSNVFVSFLSFSIMRYFEQQILGAERFVGGSPCKVAMYDVLC